MARRGVWFMLFGVVLALGAAGWWFTTSAAPEQAPVRAASHVTAQPSTLQRTTGYDRSPATISGRVLGESDGIGLAGAVVCVSPTDPYSAALHGPDTAITGPTGAWSLPGVPPGRYVVTASATGRISSSPVVVTLEPGRTHGDIDLALVAGGAPLQGSITDAGGKPLTGARVVASRAATQTDIANPAFAALTDDHGHYVLWLEPDTYIAFFDHPDHVRELRRIHVDDAGARHDQPLVPAATISGTVLSRDLRRPVAGALVTQTRSSPLYGLGPGVGARTDEQGRFTLTGVQTGVAFLDVQAPGHRSPQGLEMPIAIGEHVQGVELLVDPARRIAGFVVDAKDPAVGIPDASLVATLGASSARVSAPTGPDGAFELQGLAPGSYMLAVMASTAVATIVPGITVDQQDVTDVLVRMDRGVMLGGRVDPPETGTVRLLLAEPHENADPIAHMARMMSTMSIGRVGADGRFEFGPVIPGAYVLEITTGEGRHLRQPITATDNVAPFQLTTQAGVPVRGRVVDPQGQPVGAAAVVLRREAPVGTAGSTMAGFLGNDPLERMTDDQGRFEFPGVAPGPYQVAVRDAFLRRHRWARTTGDDGLRSRPVLVPKQAPAPGHVALELAIEAPHPIAGVVRDDRGQPVARAWVSAQPDLSGAEWSLTIDGGTMAASTATGVDDGLRRRLAQSFATSPVATDENGRFTTVPLVAGNYDLVVEAEQGQLRGMLPGVAVGTEAEAKVGRTATVHMTWGGGVDPAGELTAELSGWESRTRSTPPGEGKMVIERLLPGTYALHLSARGGSANREVTLAPGDNHVELPLASWGQVRGQLLGLDQTPQARIALLSEPVGRHDDGVNDGMQRAMAMLSALQGNPPVVTDGDGRFTLTNLAPGRHLLRFYTVPQLELRAETEVEVGPGASLELPPLHALPAPVAPGQRAHFGWTLEVRESAALAGADARDPKPARQLVVTALVPRGPASRAGIKVGDVIVAVDGFAVDHLSAHIARALLEPQHNVAAVGRKVELSRDQTKVTTRLMPEAQAP